MTNTTAYAIGGLFQIVAVAFQIVAIAYYIYAYHLKEKKSEASSQAAIDREDSSNTEIKSHVDTVRNNIMAYQDKNFQRLYDALGIGNATKPIALPLFDNAPPAIRDAYENGQAFIEQGKYPSAIAAFTEVLRFKPDFANGYVSRGSAYAGMAEHAKAISDYTEAIRLNPQCSEAFKRRGIIHYYRLLVHLSKGDWFDKNKEMALELADAVTDYDDAIKLNPSDSTAYILQGLLAQFLDDNAYAIEAFTTAIRVNPKEPGPNYPKASLLYCLRGAMYHVLAQFHDPEGDDRKAIDDLTEAIRLDPANNLAYYYRSLAYEAIGDRAKGLADQHRFTSILLKTSK